jgi:hypothetical protein
MRNLFFLAGVGLLLAGCMAERELPGREPFYRTADTAQNLGLLTPPVAKECSERVASEVPQVRIVGPFSISAQAAYRRADREHTLLPSNAADNTVAVIAPSVSRTVLGGETDIMSGCLYRLRDNRLVFEKATIFGGRINVVRDKPDNT